MIADYTLIQSKQRNDQDIEKLLPKVKKNMQYATAHFFFTDYTNVCYFRHPVVIVVLQ